MAFLLLLWTALLSVKMKLFMKKLILIIFTLLITYFSYGQVIMNIDSVDISRPTESLGFAVTPEFSIVFQDTPDEGVVPAIRIGAIIKNHSNDDIWIRAHFVDKTIEMRFNYQGKDYYKYGVWIDGDNYPEGLLLRANESKRISLGFVAPMNTPEDFTLSLSSTYPCGWDWGRNKIPDRVYLRWLRKILPSLKIIVTYDSIWGNNYRLSSAPLDLKKVVVTSNMTKKRLN